MPDIKRRSVSTDRFIAKFLFVLETHVAKSSVKNKFISSYFPIFITHHKYLILSAYMYQTDLFSLILSNTQESEDLNF